MNPAMAHATGQESAFLGKGDSHSTGDSRDRSAGRSSPVSPCPSQWPLGHARPAVGACDPGEEPPPHSLSPLFQQPCRGTAWPPAGLGAPGLLGEPAAQHPGTWGCELFRFPCQGIRAPACGRWSRRGTASSRYHPESASRGL